MKTIRQWLETIADKEIREAAIRNTLGEWADIQKVDSLHLAIKSAFYWDSTPEEDEGDEYWSVIYSQALTGTLKTIEG